MFKKASQYLRKCSYNIKITDSLEKKLDIEKQKRNWKIFNLDQKNLNKWWLN